MTLNWEAMSEAGLDEVMAVELRAYPFPWTRGNFRDALRSGNHARLVRDGQGRLLGYYVVMLGVDEAHLLNLTVEPDAQRRGLGAQMLQALCDWCMEGGLAQVWLEVREHNAGARRLYERAGFRPVGVRPRYYPAAHGQREAAIVMRKWLRAAVMEQADAA